MNAPDDLIPIDEVCRLVGGRDRPVSRPTIYRAIKAGRLPAPIHPVGGISRWRRSKLIAAIIAATGEAV